LSEQYSWATGHLSLLLSDQYSWATVSTFVRPRDSWATGHLYQLLSD
jgi:hypothetical protein